MDKKTILELTLAQFGLLQEPPLELICLRMIASLATHGSEESRLLNDSIMLAGEIRASMKHVTPERRSELERSFMERLKQTQSSDAKNLGQAMDALSKNVNERFLKHFDDEKHRLGVITVADVLEGWEKNKALYSRNPDRTWRFVIKLHMMKPLLLGLEYLGYPSEEIQKLNASASSMANSMGYDVERKLTPAGI